MKSYFSSVGDDELHGRLASQNRHSYVTHQEGFFKSTVQGFYRIRTFRLVRRTIVWKLMQKLFHGRTHKTYVQCLSKFLFIGKKSVRFRKIIFIGSVGPDLSHLDFTPDLFEPAVCRQDERKNQNGYDTMILT